MFCIDLCWWRCSAPHQFVSFTKEKRRKRGGARFDLLSYPFISLKKVPFGQKELFSCMIEMFCVNCELWMRARSIRDRHAVCSCVLSEMIISRSEVFNNKAASLLSLASVTVCFFHIIQYHTC